MAEASAARPAAQAARARDPSDRGTIPAQAAGARGGDSGTIMSVPADLEARVAPLIGAPFRPKGDDPSGWDCRGCARWCLRTFCGVATPDYQDLYQADIITSARGLARRAELIAAELAAWRPVPPQAGAVAFLSWMGRAGHVGFMVGPRRFLHADLRTDTTIADLDDPACPYRLRGAFVPSFVDVIVHLT